MILRLFIQPSSMHRGEGGRWGGGGFSPCQGQKGSDSLVECSLTKQQQKKRSRNSWQRSPVLQSSQIVLLCHGLWIFFAVLIFYQQRKHFYPLVLLLHPDRSYDTHPFSLWEAPNDPPPHIHFWFLSEAGNANRLASRTAVSNGTP